MSGVELYAQYQGQGSSCTRNIRVRGWAVRAISGSGVELYVQYRGQGSSGTCSIRVWGWAVRAISGSGVELYAQYQGQGSNCACNIRVRGRAVRAISGSGVERCLFLGANSRPFQMISMVSVKARSFSCFRLFSCLSPFVQSDWKGVNSVHACLHPLRLNGLFGLPLAAALWRLCA